jgi:hypothetical protein
VRASHTNNPIQLMHASTSRPSLWRASAPAREQQPLRASQAVSGTIAASHTRRVLLGFRRHAHPGTKPGVNSLKHIPTLICSRFRTSQIIKQHVSSHQEGDAPDCFEHPYPISKRFQCPTTLLALFSVPHFRRRLESWANTVPVMVPLCVSR